MSQEKLSMLWYKSLLIVKGAELDLGCMVLHAFTFYHYDIISTHYRGDIGNAGKMSNAGREGKLENTGKQVNVGKLVKLGNAGKLGNVR